MTALFAPMAEVLTPRRSGDVVISHFEVSATAAQQLAWAHDWTNHHRAQEGLVALPSYAVDTPGRYAQLTIAGDGWMWDVPRERASNVPAVANACGDVLIVGLGLGMILHPILRKPSVRSVRVLEINRHVIELVRPTLRHVVGAEKLTIEEADADRWAPPIGDAFDAVWIDCIAGFAYTLGYLRWCEWYLQRFARFLAPGGWLGHWMQPEVATHLLGAPDQQTTGWLSAATVAALKGLR